jgi:oligopeptide/dipeptide ABC transporter ATP-binding protein
MAVLDVRKLSVTYRSGDGDVYAVDDVSFTLEKGDSLGLVGESGSGKTTIGKAILRLLPEGCIAGDSHIVFDGKDLLDASEREMRAIRGRKIGLIPQSAMNALDPVVRVGDLITEAMVLHGLSDRGGADGKIKELFASVGLDMDRRMHYPHMFSGGMRQRAVIAMAFALEPSLIIADEPTTGLDVIMQGQILKELSKLVARTGSTFMIITHDMGVVAEHCRTVAVMYAGRLVEVGPARDILLSPSHPYTMGLRNGFLGVSGKAREVISIPGAPPRLAAPVRGCPFRPRCPFSESRCETEKPPMQEASCAHRVACHFRERASEMREQAMSPAAWREAPGE